MPTHRDINGVIQSINSWLDNQCRLMMIKDSTLVWNVAEVQRSVSSALSRWRVEDHKGGIECSTTMFSKFDGSVLITLDIKSRSRTQRETFVLKNLKSQTKVVDYKPQMELPWPREPSYPPLKEFTTAEVVEENDLSNSDISEELATEDDSLCQMVDKKTKTWKNVVNTGLTRASGAAWHVVDALF